MIVGVRVTTRPIVLTATEFFAHRTRIQFRELLTAADVHAGNIGICT